jgi:large repetitive protein
MKTILSTLLCLLYISTNGQTTIWQETFDPAPLAGWNLNASTGINDPDANFWQITDDEGGVLPPGCGVPSNGNNTLHITNTLLGGGATYNAGGLCGLLFCVETHTRAESPTISSLGNTNMTLTFDYIENGDGVIDNATIYYSVNGGTTWLLLNDPAKTIVCSSTQGQWTSYSYALPAACNNIANLKIGFNWENNDDGTGTDPSVAINNIKITTPSSVNIKPNAVNDTVNTNCNTLINILAKANDTDPNAGQLLNINGVFNVTSGTVSTSSNSINFTPASGFTGQISFGYIVCDNGSPSLCDSALIVVNVSNAGCNQTPIAIDDTVNVACNSGFITVSPMGNDYDPDAGQIIYMDSLTYVGGYASITNNPTYNSFQYKPLTNYNGLSYVNYLVCDNGVPKKCDTGTVYFIIAPCNTAPNASNDAATSNCGALVSKNVLVNDTDPDAGQTITVTGVFNVNNGIATYSGSTVTFTPTAGFTGTTTLQYIVCDNGSPSLCDTATITYTVTNTGCNVPPNASNDVSNTNCNTSKIINVLNNDTDPNPGTTLIVSGVFNVTNGSTTNTLATITFTPTTGFSGIATFSYIVCDNGSPSLCDTAVVTVTVASTGCNSAPIALDDNMTVSCNTTANKNVIANDSEPDAGQTITITGIINVTGGTATNTISNINFVPTPGYSGLATVTYVVCDNGSPSLCDTAIFFITIIAGPGCNTPPYAGNDFGIISCTQTNTIIVLGNDSDANGNTLTVTQILGTPQNGTVSIGSNNLVIYNPNFCSPGTDTFYYVICDNGTPSLCDTGRVVVSSPACGCNVAPVAYDDTLYAACGLLTTKNITLNDKDANTGTIFTVSSLYNTGGIVGSLVQVGNIIQYTPPVGYTGIQQFNYIVCDNGVPSKCDTGTVTLITTACNSAPTANTDFANTLCNSAINISVLLNDTDPDAGSILTAALITNAKHGNATINSNIISYTPSNCYFGADTIVYKICDNGVPQLCDTSFIILKIDTCSCNKPVANFSTSDTEICVGDCIDFTDLSTNNPTAWSWVFDGVVPNTSILKNPINICYNTAGAFNVSLTASNINGAGLPEIKTARVVVSPVTPTTIVNIIDTIGNTISLNATQTGGTNYAWTPSTGLSNINIPNPILTVVSSNTYSCNYLNANGCNSKFIVNLNAIPGPLKTNYIWVPNAFSPNGDGDNAVFKAISNNVASFEMIIYNRWGNKVFATTDINQAWNGTTNGVDNISQVFFYYLRVTFNDGKSEIRKGDITVVF